MEKNISPVLSTETTATQHHKLESHPFTMMELL
jgi:hypothetical protein